MEKIRRFIIPDEFVTLKVVKSSLEFIRLEGDLRDRSRLQRVLSRLDSQRLSLAGFPNALKVPNKLLIIIPIKNILFIKLT